MRKCKPLTKPKVKLSNVLTRRHKAIITYIFARRWADPSYANSDEYRSIMSTKQLSDVLMVYANAPSGHPAEPFLAELNKMFPFSKHGPVFFAMNKENKHG